MRTNYLIPTLTISACAFLSCTNNQKSELQSGPEKPNILLILTDDQGWGDIRSHGNDTIETPVLDNLASQSYRFDRFYVSPVCAPTRASLLTGRYHLRTGVNGVTGRREVMRDTEYTIAELFKENEYTTACFGKWHNGAQFPHNPNGQGFDQFLGFCAGRWSSYHDTELEYNGKIVKTKGYIADVLTDSAISYITENKDKPFFTYVAYNTPHTPSQVPDKYFNKYKAKGLDDMLACTLGMCENIDDNVGRLLSSLEKNGLSENTIVIFLTDNGPNSWRFNGGMKGKKAWVDEGGVRVPLFMKIPWKNTSEKHVKAISAHIDILPTLSSFCKLKLPEGLEIDGIDLTEYINNPEKVDKERIIFTDRGVSTKTPYSLRSHEYVLSIGRDSSLYDIINDPGQKSDISGEYPELKDSLIRVYENWYDEVSRFGFDIIPIQVGHKNIHQIRMPVHEAALSKNLKFYRGHGWANDWVINFKSMKDTLAWKLNVIDDGTYKVVLLLDSPYENINNKINLEYDGLNSKTILEKEYNSYVVDTKDKLRKEEVQKKEWAKLEFHDVSIIKGKYDLKICLENNLKKAIEIKGIVLIKIAG